MLRFTALLIAGAACALAQIQPLDEAAYQKLIAAHKGSVVLVDFWATWCKPCRAELPELVKLEARLRSKGLKLVTVSADEPEKQAEALKFVSQLGVPKPVYIRRANDDDKFIGFVDPKWTGALPALMIYDKTGKRVRSFYGETPLKDVEAALAKLL